MQTIQREQIMRFANFHTSLTFTLWMWKTREAPIVFMIVIFHVSLKIVVESSVGCHHQSSVHEADIRRGIANPSWMPEDCNLCNSAVKSWILIHSWFCRSDIGRFHPLRGSSVNKLVNGKWDVLWTTLSLPLFFSARLSFTQHHQASCNMQRNACRPPHHHPHLPLHGCPLVRIIIIATTYPPHI